MIQAKLLCSPFPNFLVWHGLSPAAINLMIVLLSLFYKKEIKTILKIYWKKLKIFDCALAQKVGYLFKNYGISNSLNNSIPFTSLFGKNEIQYGRNEIQFGTNEIQN